MDYTAPYAKRRLTGRGYFTLTGDTSAVDLGNIQMIKTDYGIKRKEHFSARRGILTLDRQDAYGSQLVWTITLDEFVGPTLIFAWGGTANADFTQSTGTAATKTFTTASLKGRTFDIGKYGIFNASLTTPGSKVEGYAADYVIDRGAGKLYIPLSSTIADGATLVVTYDAPTLVYSSLQAMQVLNRPGSLELHAEDDSGKGLGTGTDAIPPSREIYTVPCILSVDDMGDFKPDDFRTWQVKCTATAAMTVKNLK
jgi:hypothetical protein